eukprot:jgi/Phyca11/510604/fgenesh2_kg.PHYCAscaffold_63_\
MTPASVGGFWVVQSSSSWPQRLQSWFWNNTTWIRSLKQPNSLLSSLKLKRQLYRQFSSAKSEASK